MSTAKISIDEIINLYNNKQFNNVIEKSYIFRNKFPKSHSINNILGVTYATLGNYKQAIKYYNEALLINPNFAEAYNNLGIIIAEQGKYVQAIKAFKKSLSIKPNYTDAHFNLANTLVLQNKIKESIQSYLNVLHLDPDYEMARAKLLHLQSKICDWNAIEQNKKYISRLGTSNKYVLPWSMLSLEDNPLNHKKRSEIYTHFNFLSNPLPLPAKPLNKPKRIRIGYFSSDFKEHPVSYLLAGILENHDRNQFEIFGYSIKGNNEDDLRKRLIKSFDVFDDISFLSDKDAALLARQDKIDIAVDLNGYTLNARSQIFAHRAAPIQINYLGYNVTMGANFIDYMFTDKNVIPLNCQHYCSEKLIYLPDTFMPTDNNRKFSEKLISRKEMGLPEKGFVFCCFNNDYKISKVEFNIWMRLLRNIDNSVLWLRKSNKLSNENLIKEACKRNINPNRIIFAERIPMDEHLTRHKLADLFIDTFNCNANATAVDSLVAGLPVVTKIGEGPPTRVSASLLQALDMPELITNTLEGYESLIFDLATNPTKLFKIKRKLKENIHSKPLFDTKLYTRNLENGFKKVYQNYFDNKSPKTIIVGE